MAKRLAGRLGYPADDPFRVTLHPEKLDLPLRWRKPRRIFVNSMSDLFHPDVPDDFIDEVFGVMAKAYWHTFQVLTKRPERMAQYLSQTSGPDNVISRMYRAAEHYPWPLWAMKDVNRGGGGGGWPLPNVWTGVSVENQQTADERIPFLLQTPAAVRFVSVEPLLGSVDVTPWMPAKAPMLPDEAPATWAEFPWPDWVPARVRAEIEAFWSGAGRGPREWLQNIYVQHSHPFGALVAGEDGYRAGAPMTTGRWVHCWNNIGRLVHEDGSVSNSAVYGWQRPPIHWIIVGGESGPGARPMHPAWARSLRDQCRGAGVPFLFKQWGEWAPLSEPFRYQPALGSGNREYTHALRAFARQHGASALLDDRPEGWGRAMVESGTCISDGERVIGRVGKKAAGRLLDGVEWDEYPQ